MTPSADDIADCVLSTFSSIPAKRKPRQRDDNCQEWIPLSGIVLSRDDQPLLCASLATGMKCLPQSKIPLANGIVLHDWHAEVLAIRAFNRFLIDECADLAAKGLQSSQWLARREQSQMTMVECQPYEIREDVTIHMYCSEAPCGDASMELVMRAQEDDTPWPVPPAAVDGRNNDGAGELRGRGYFSELGVVRRKPSRPDAPVTLSKSCTDKLALKQCTSLLSSLASLLINPRNAYLHTLVLPKSQHVPEAVQRAFSPAGRMSSLRDGDSKEWSGGYRYQPFEVNATSREFAYSRRNGGGKGGKKMVPCNISAVYTPRWQETIIGGGQHGRKPFDPRGASKVCRKGTWQAAVAVAETIALPLVVGGLQYATYGDLKENALLNSRRAAKEAAKAEALQNWQKNSGDDEFGL